VLRARLEADGVIVGVPPLVTFSCHSTPAAASAEQGSAPTSTHETVSGLRVKINPTAYSA